MGRFQRRNVQPLGSLAPTSFRQRAVNSHAARKSRSTVSEIKVAIV